MGRFPATDRGDQPARDMPSPMNPILANKHPAEVSVFTAENLLREARRQKRIPPATVPEVCVLDPDGDIGALMLGAGRAAPSPGWACYHTQLLLFGHAGVEMGLVRCAVGAPYAVLVAEELFASGCRLLISVTSAGRIADGFGSPPYFVLIEQAWRDEGTSYHYLSPGERAAIRPDILRWLRAAFHGAAVAVHTGTAWTTDAPFRETESAIRFYRERGVAAVEMESAALYAFAEARDHCVICFAHVTNQMAAIEGDFEKGQHNGAMDALEVIRLTVSAWLEADRRGPGRAQQDTP